MLQCSSFSRSIDNRKAIQVLHEFKEAVFCSILYSIQRGTWKRREVISPSPRFRHHKWSDWLMLPDSVHMPRTSEWVTHGNSTPTGEVGGRAWQGSLHWGPSWPEGESWPSYRLELCESVNWPADIVRIKIEQWNLPISTQHSRQVVGDLLAAVLFGPIQWKSFKVWSSLSYFCSFRTPSSIGFGSNSTIAGP